MKILGLISGGKDSFYNLMQCVANGHQIIALGNLHPAAQDKKDELDSYMYQTVGHDVIHLYKDCLDVPLYRQEIKGKPIEQSSDYVITAMDETEDLFELLKRVKDVHPDLQAVSVGAILSNYQRIRVESVCARLGLVALAYLWQRNQEELLQEMAQAGINAILIKVAAIGLKRQHLGRSIGDMYPHLCRMNKEYDLHICGEGGEYETITLDCPLFKRRIIVDEFEIVIHSDDHFAQVAYLRFKKLHLEDKTESEIDPSWTADVNLNPLWDADSLMMPIEDVVRSKQQPREINPAVLQRGSGVSDRNSKDGLCSSQSSYRSKLLTHQGAVVCAVGGTNAYEPSPSSKITRHLSIAEETTACLQNLKAKIERIGLSWAEVVFMQVFVSDMGDFGVVNAAYKAFFGINPPPRACVGANLPNSIRIQVSCTAIRKDALSPKPRQTLHVQGISYWAPANIGPYSQATEQVHHSFIAGQIGMVPRTLELPVPSSLAKETAWSLRNLTQIAALRQSDLVNRTALCIVYVTDPVNFAPVKAAWEHIANKSSPAPVLAICMPSLPKGAQVEWQTILHHGKVYADKEPLITEADGNEDGYETDDDDLYQLEKRILHPTVLSLVHEQPSVSTAHGVELQWKASTQSWFLAPLLMALSVICLPECSPLTSLLSSPSLSKEQQDEQNDHQEYSILTRDILKDMMDLMIKAMDRIIESHIAPVAGPGIPNGWKDVVEVTLYYHDTVFQRPEVLGPAFEDLLAEVAGSSSNQDEDTPQGNIAVTLVPVQAIADNAVLAMTMHAVGKLPTVPGLMQP